MKSSYDDSHVVYLGYHGPEEMLLPEEQYERLANWGDIPHRHNSRKELEWLRNRSGFYEN